MVSFARATFGFNALPLTFLTVVTSAILGLIVFSSSSAEPPSVTDAQAPLLNYAWSQLEAISEKPHPYFSHENDRVRKIILEEVYKLANRDDHFRGAQVEVDDSQTDIFIQKKNVFRDKAPPGKLVYFEGNNVLVRLSSESSNKDLGAILLSAHFDSVPTSYGTTDDGSGIVTMMAVLRHLLSRTNGPKRDVIFNFNNNEEFGLLGGEAFMHHPWSKNVSAFINLEGTGAGGKAILFRATDYGVASHYSAAEMPFASSVYQQGFSHGLVHSQTDYQIYADAGLRGMDIAFYKPRALYHTRRDDIRETSKEAINHMLVNVVNIVESMVEADSFDYADQPAVFTDVGGYFFVILPLNHLFVISCLVLCVGALTVVPLTMFVVRKQFSNGCSFSETILGGWLRSIVSLVVSIAATYFVVHALRMGNELYVIRSFYTPLIAGLGTFLTVNYVILGFFHFIRPVCDQKLVILLLLSGLLWVSLLMTAIHEVTQKATGEYQVLIMYAVVASASVVGLVGHLMGSADIKPVAVVETTEDSGDATEATPLLARTDSGAEQITEQTEQEVEDVELVETSATQTKSGSSLYYDWLAQFILVVPVTFFISFSLAVTFLSGLHQTPLESVASSKLIYAGITGMSVLIGLAFLPFVHKLHFIVPIVLVATTVTACLIHIASPPFSMEGPAKMRFVQNIDLDDKTNYANVLGRNGLVQNVLEYIPSTTDNKPMCKPKKDGIITCDYVAPRPWLVEEELKPEGDDDKYPDIPRLMKVEVVPVDEPSSGPFDRFEGRLKITAVDNRVCMLKFNTTRFQSGDIKSGISPVKMVTLRHNRLDGDGDAESEGQVETFGWTRDPKTGKDEFRSFMHGVDEVSIHKLDWNDTSYDVQLSWIPRWYEIGDPEEASNDSRKNRLGVTVTCSWSEYYDNTRIIENGEVVIKDKIPAFTELLKYSPKWALWSSQKRGLVEVSKYIEL